MTKDFSTVVRDIYALFDGQDLTTEISHFSDKLGQVIAHRFIEHGLDRNPTLRMSNLGKPLRQLYYELTGVEGEPLEPETKFKFTYGAILEELVLFLIKQAGHTVEAEQYEVEIDGVKGHIDGIVDGVLIDIKSCSTYSFKKFKDGTLAESDAFGYIPQLASYANALKLKRAAFIAVDKVRGNICVYELSPEQLQYDVPSRIRTVREALSRTTEPERCYEPEPVSKKDKTGNMVLGISCSYCPFKTFCWRDSNQGQGLQTRIYSTGPKFFVELLVEPRLKYNQEGTFEEFPVKEE